MGENDNARKGGMARATSKEKAEALLASVSAGVDGTVGSGVSIVKVARMKAVLSRTPSFARKVFSAEECAFCERHALPEVPFALRFAAKSAVARALGIERGDGMGVRDVEVCLSSKGRPFVVLSGAARRFAQEQGVVDLPLSLSFTHTDAVACALAITRDSQRAAAERIDQKQELARQFKEARTLLDEMGGSAEQKEEDAVRAQSEAPGENEG